MQFFISWILLILSFIISNRAQNASFIPESFVDSGSDEILDPYQDQGESEPKNLSDSTPESETKSNSKLAISIIIPILICLCLIIGFFMWKKRRDHKKAAQYNNVEVIDLSVTEYM